MLKIYGISNCDTMKKAMTWLNDNHVDFEFHDYKKKGISEEKVQEWLKQKSWEVLINRAGTTWKKLPDEEKATNAETAAKLMIEKTSVIKRPIVEKDKIITLGFDAGKYEQLFRQE